MGGIREERHICLRAATPQQTRRAGPAEGGCEPGLWSLLLLLRGSRMGGNLTKERDSQTTQAVTLHHGQSRGAESSSRGGGHHQHLHGPILHPLSLLINLLVFLLQSPHPLPKWKQARLRRASCFRKLLFSGQQVVSVLSRGENPCVLLKHTVLRFTTLMFT